MKSTILIIFGGAAVIAAVFSAAVLEGAVNAHQDAISKTKAGITQVQ